MSYKRSMPICFSAITKENIHEYLDMLKKCKADRVFICGLNYIYLKTTELYTETERIREIISYFKNNGLEVGIWVDAFGHGGPLVGYEGDVKGSYTLIEGIDGRCAHTICPSDEKFVADYSEGIKRIASLSPDLIMLDDDFRVNGRISYYLGCFCENHLKKFRLLVGEEVAREDIERLITTGGKNKYRDAYLDMIADMLLGFAKKLRKAVDEVNPNIRLGASSPLEGWDLSGTSLIEIAKAFAGNTKPFARIAGAPYWDNNVIAVSEAARLQFNYGKDKGVELFAEGDTYPRPRYNVASKGLETFEAIMIADGGGDGVLSYIFDYNQTPSYEPGYVTRFIKNEDRRLKIIEMAKNGKPVGVRVLNVAEKMRDFDMPKEVKKYSIRFFEELRSFTPGAKILSKNSIPTCFEDSGYPVLVFGENAKHVCVSDLKNGAILDIRSADILQKRGIDVGLVSFEPKAFSSEYYVKNDDEILAVTHPHTQKISVSENAKVETYFKPDNTPASYRYENANGQKFFVMAFDYFNFDGDFNANYICSYYRQEQLEDAIYYLSGKTLPAFIKKNPNLYNLCKKDENGNLFVMLANVSIDDV
ncbi:MAG: hypothetical protein J6V66_02535, partial [Clostridia bacterium]|nr:hypothetical protein [Clostridia bacterium]